MVDKLISVGNKIELKQILNKAPDDESETDIRLYKSQVLDIDDANGVIHGAMPIYEGHLVPLEVGTRYDAFFQTSKGLYRTVCQVTGRSKEEKIYIVHLKPISELEKYQRREYFRLSTNIDVSTCQIAENELKTFMLNKIIPETYENEEIYGIINDISGGGARILSKAEYKKGSVLMLSFDMLNDAEINHISVMAKVVACNKSLNRPELNEIRVQFRWITNTLRELIVKNIFEEQRRLRQKERGW